MDCGFEREPLNFKMSIQGLCTNLESYVTILDSTQSNSAQINKLSAELLVLLRVCMAATKPHKITQNCTKSHKIAQKRPKTHKIFKKPIFCHFVYIKKHKTHYFSYSKSLKTAVFCQGKSA